MKGETDFGMPRDVSGKHFHRLITDDSNQPCDDETLRQSDAIIGAQYGSNRFASRKLMTEYGAPRDVRGPHYHHLVDEDPDITQHFSEDQIRKADGIIGGQYGTNRFASRKLMTEYGAPRDVKGPHMHHLMADDGDSFQNFTEEQMRQIDGIIPGQYGTNRFASRKGMTEYGAPRDVKGNHMHRTMDDDPQGFGHFNEEQLRASDAIIPGQYGTNKFDSQRGMTNFGMPRDVRGAHLHTIIDDVDFEDLYMQER